MSEEKLKEAAYRFLSFRPRSQKELRDYLKKKSKGKEEDSIEKIVEQLCREGYVNDREFARWWIETRWRAKNPYGPRFIFWELRQKGVAVNIVEEELSQLYDFRREVLHATQLVKRRFKKFLRSNSKKDKFKRRVRNLLYRRGFTADCVREVIKSLG